MVTADTSQHPLGRTWHPRDLLVAGALIVLTIALIPPRLESALQGDEASYASAALYGWRANAVDEGFLNPLRHYHPPGLHYLAMVSLALFGHTETAFRLPTYLAAVASPVVLYLSLRALLGIAPFLAVAWATLLAASPITAEVAMYARPHSLVGLGALAVAALAARALGTGRTRDLASCAIALAATALAMEYGALLLLLVSAALVWLPNPWITIGRRGIHTSWALFACAAAGLTLFLGSWPAGLLHYPANFFFYAVYWRALGFPVMWMGRLTQHPPGWASIWWMFKAAPWATAALVGGLASSVVALRPGVRSEIRLVCLFALCLFAVSFLQHQIEASYAFYYLPVASLASAAASDRLGRWPRLGVTVLVIGAALATGAPRLVANVRRQTSAGTGAGIRALAGTVAPGARVAMAEPAMLLGPAFYLNGGLRRHGPETVEAVAVGRARGNRSDVFWRIGDAEIPVEVDPTVMGLLRVLGHGGRNVLMTTADGSRVAFEAEVGAGRWTHALLRVPWPPDSDWIAATVAGHWRQVKAIPLAGGRQLVLYAAPQLRPIDLAGPVTEVR